MVKTNGHNTSSIVSQVSLVHASDSIRTVLGGERRPPSVVPTSSGHATTSMTVHSAPSTSSGVPFVSAATTLQRMSKPPVRVVAQSPSAHHHHYQHHHYQQQQLHQNPQNQKLQMQLQQQLLNRPHMIPTMQVQPMAGRSNMDGQTIKRAVQTGDEYGKQQNSMEMMHKVRAIRRQVADEETELRRLRELEHETNVLREKNLGREKELAAECVKLDAEQNLLRSATMRVQSLTKHLEEMYKRRQTAAAAALVEHRKMQQLNLNSRPAGTTTTIPEVVRPRASVEPFQVVPASAQNHDENEKLEKDADFVDGFDAINIPSEPAYHAPSPKKVEKSKTSPSPPKDPHPNPSHHHQHQHHQQQQSLSTFAAPQLVTFEQKINSSTMNRDSPTAVVVERPTAFGESLDESRLRSGKTDLVSLRSDSLKATKRRSWAASEGTSMSEAEMIHRLLDEQRRGRNHFIPQLPTPQEESASQLEEVMEETMKALPTTEVAVTTTIPAKTEQPLKEAAMSDLCMAGSDTTTEEEVSVKSDDEMMMELEVASEKRLVKGILRRPNEKMNKGRIQFDPLALLLDAALEGELDLVKSSASKLHDVSQANDEGITALHNAICAGHYEIVRFLIEKDADVNAQDSDGWTPLHCAASCNNLPMVRQLVEGGGCVLASTLSDMETPVEKCEEEEDGYDGCLKYLVAAHNSTGSLNDGKVYAAYGYEAEFEDELSFEAGDELVVTSKDDVDKHWWTCKKSNGETGLVPRTYLALYPALKYRKNLNFVMFDLPLESNNNFD